MRHSIIALSAIFVAACTQTGGQETATTQADAEAIKAVLTEGCTAFSAGNLDGFMAFYADDAVSMPPDAAPRTGKEAIRSSIQALYAESSFELTCQADEVRVSGDLAVLLATWDETATPGAGGEPTQLHGKLLMILQRQPDGSWKWWREMWSVYTPSDT